MMHGLAFLATLAASAFFPAAQDPAREELEKLKKEVERLKQRLDEDSRREAERESLPAFLQKFRLQLYSNVTARFDDQDSVRNAAVLGQVNLFIQADLGEGLTVLNENVLISRLNPATGVNEQVDTVQRLYAKYKYADWCSVKFGREHTPFGYWNYEFHHSGYLQTPVERPLMWTFESSGGILPTHYVGPELSGRVDWLGGLAYTLFAGNGHGRLATEVQNVSDVNEEKAFGARLEHVGLSDAFGLSGTGLADLRIGASAYFDTVTAGAAKTKFEELILGAHLHLSWGAFSLAAEGFVMTHDDEDLAQERKFQGGYALVSYEIGGLNLTPYALGERMNFDSSDPFFGTRPDVNQVRLGVRWDFHPNAAVKLEYDKAFLREEDNVDAFLIDVSFGI